MKSYPVYVCEKCGRESRNRQNILCCEAEHLGLTVAEKQEHDHLKSLVER